MAIDLSLISREGRVQADKTITGVEVSMDRDEFIVSKTDLKGAITYANRTFIDIAGYSEAELIGQPHSIIRHPDMPRCVFKLLWDTISQGQEVFAYVVNRCKNGDHYWVYAHVTPTFDASGSIVSYHSNRRLPERSIVQDVITPLYAKLRAEEERHSNRKQGLQASTQMLLSLLADSDVDYNEFVLKLSPEWQRGGKVAA